MVYDRLFRLGAICTTSLCISLNLLSSISVCGVHISLAYRINYCYNQLLYHILVQVRKGCCFVVQKLHVSCVSLHMCLVTASRERYFQTFLLRGCNNASLSLFLRSCRSPSNLAGSFYLTFLGIESHFLVLASFRHPIQNLLKDLAVFYIFYPFQPLCIVCKEDYNYNSMPSTKSFIYLQFSPSHL